MADTTVEGAKRIHLRAWPHLVHLSPSHELWLVTAAAVVSGVMSVG